MTKEEDSPEIEDLHPGESSWAEKTCSAVAFFIWALPVSFAVLLIILWQIVTGLFTWVVRKAAPSS